MSLHVELCAALERYCANRLAGAVELRQDAILVRLDNGVELQVRFADADAYSLRWSCDGAELGIDTAPCHAHLATSPNHLHLADGRVVADPLTRPGAEPWDNLRAVVDAVLANPLLA